MAEKKSKQHTPVSQNRLRAIDDPTAAFPIGALAGLVAELEDESEDGATPVDDTTGDEASTSEEVSGPAGPSSISPALVVMSLLGGGLLAVMVAAGLGLLLLMF